MDEEDDRDFWDDIPTYSSKRVHIGSRTHRGMAPPRRRQPIFARPAPGEPNPLLLRIGVLAGGVFLLIPVALTLRGGDDANVLRAAPTGGAVALPAGPAPVVQTIVIESVAPETVPVAPRADAAQATAVCALPYRVASGDYWIGIAQKVKVGLSSLLDINNATTATPLHPQRTICLPLDATVPTTAT